MRNRGLAVSTMVQGSTWTAESTRAWGATRVAASGRMRAAIAMLALLAMPDLSAGQMLTPRLAPDGTATAVAPAGLSAALAAAADAAPSARGQRTPPPRAVSGGEPAVSFNVLFHVGALWLTAKDSFEAILDTSNGFVFGGGGEAVLRSGIFVRGDVSRFNEEGERVFVSNGEVFKLGQPLTVTLTPVEFTGGYRFGHRRQAPAGGGTRLVPYAGGGVGVLRYREESDTDTASERISDSFTSYHVLGGLDVSFSRMFSAGAEFQHRWVPDGLGEGGVSKEFGETDLGGSTVRALFRVHF